MRVVVGVLFIVSMILGIDYSIQNKHIQQFEDSNSILKDGVIVDRYSIGSIDQYKLN